MDQVSWESWFSELDMETEDLGAKNPDQEEEELFLRGILQHPAELSSESEAVLSPLGVDGGATTGNLASSIHSVFHSQQCASEGAPPTAYVLSFDRSTVIPAVPDPGFHCLNRGDDISISLKPKRTPEDLNDEPTVNRGTKKARSGSGALDHIMSERRRRQELTERFIALSATIPGLKKIDKASILSEAISYVKQLQQRVRELEEDTNKTMKKSQASAEHNVGGGLHHSETESDDYYTPNDVLPEVKARISDNNQVLIRILCQKQKCTMLRILDELKNLHLNVFGNSVIPFGSSAVDITIIAQMTEEYRITVMDVVKSLKVALLSDGNPC